MSRVKPLTTCDGGGSPGIQRSSMWFKPRYRNMISGWAGSLPLYNTGSGNVIVVSPANVCAKWEHENGWGGDDEDPFWSLNWTMSELVDEFLAYLVFGEE